MCILNVDAILVFQPSLTSHTRSVVHDVPVGVIPQRNWDDYEEPAMPDFDVSVNYFLLSSPFFLLLNISFYLILILHLHCYTIKKIENHSVHKVKNLI